MFADGAGSDVEACRYLLIFPPGGDVRENLSFSGCENGIRLGSSSSVMVQLNEVGPEELEHVDVAVAEVALFSVEVKAAEHATRIIEPNSELIFRAEGAQDLVVERTPSQVTLWQYVRPPNGVAGVYPVGWERVLGSQLEVQRRDGRREGAL